MKKRLIILCALLLAFAVCARAEEEGRVYVMGNFYFGMPLGEVRALDRTGAGLYASDIERGVQRTALISDNFVVTLWFDGLDEAAPLIEMDFAFYMPPDSIAMREGNLEIQTSSWTARVVYAYVERMCKKTFGTGRSSADGELPFESLLFPDADASFLTGLRVYTQKDGSKTDLAVHLQAGKENAVNYLICRQAE